MEANLKTFPIKKLDCTFIAQARFILRFGLLWYSLLPMGVMRILGNQRQMQDFWLMLPFLLGILLSVTVFIFFWRNYVGRTFMPLVALLGFAVPFIPPL
ncbi:hypothetical protein [Lactovum odontotermitis]